MYVDGERKGNSPNQTNAKWAQRDHTFTIDGPAEGKTIISNNGDNGDNNNNNDDSGNNNGIISTTPRPSPRPTPRPTPRPSSRSTPRPVTSTSASNSSINGGSSSSNSNSNRCRNVKITFKADKYGKETSVFFKSRSTGQNVMSSKNEVGAFQSKTLERCLPPGTYTLTIEDIDGLCCRNGNGFYKISVDGTDLAQGGYFIKSRSHTIKIGYDYMSEMSNRDKDWLSAHNSRRRTYHQNAGKTYRPLRWSTSLASDAKTWANSLLDDCDITGIKHEKNVNDGENLAKNNGTGKWGAMYPADNIVKRWVDNEATWPYPRVSSSLRCVLCCLYPLTSSSKSSYAHFHSFF